MEGSLCFYSTLGNKQKLGLTKREGFSVMRGSIGVLRVDEIEYQKFVIACPTERVLIAQWL